MIFLMEDALSDEITAVIPWVCFRRKRAVMPRRDAAEPVRFGRSHPGTPEAFIHREAEEDGGNAAPRWTVTL